MTRTRSHTATATAAIALVEALQQHFKAALEAAARQIVSDHSELEPIEWLRDGGRHGGGLRYVAVETPVFNRVALNVSHVHYEGLPDKRMRSATALSTIIHPRNPWAPSMHMHISWTELADGDGYWRMMADLNPAIPVDADRDAFAAALRGAAPAVYEQAAAQGDRYFFIPALERHRGVTHFYLESYSSGDFEADRSMALALGRAAIDCYVALVVAEIEAHPEPSAADRSAQLAYHTLYLLQVLTLDRGTTSGILVHDQNDVGIMGSLPAYVARTMLGSWVPRLPELQRPLLQKIVATLPATAPSHVGESVRARLAAVLREHYRAHPEALELQARGDVVPPTIDNHQA